jgi:hypothetical protein
VCTHDKENHKRCDKGTAQKQYVTREGVTREGVTREGVISAFHFSETRVFDLISQKYFVDELNMWLFMSRETVKRLETKGVRLFYSSHELISTKLPLCISIVLL